MATPFDAIVAAKDADGDPIFAEESPLFQLIREFRLSSFDADVLLLSLASEIDLRYEKIFAYLQDDVTRKRPTVELMLNLLCRSGEEKLRRRAHFYPYAPLVRNALVYLAPDPHQPDASFLAHGVRIDDQITRLLLGQTGVDSRLDSWCDLFVPLETQTVLPLESDLVPILTRLVKQSANGSLRAYFQGPAETEKLHVAEALATSLGVPVLHVRAARLAEKSDFESLCRLLMRDARINRAVLYVSEIDELGARTESAWGRQALLEQVKQHSGITILAGRRGWEPQSFNGLALIPIDFDVPEYETREALWASHLTRAGYHVDANAMRTLAGRFRLTAGQIAQAATFASLSAEWHASAASSHEESRGIERIPIASPSLRELTAAARSQCGHELSAAACKIEPKYRWDDLVLPSDQTEQLREVCAQALHRQTVYGDWGFDRKLSLGKGLNVLFCGPPGTGKTMAAEVIACELDLDLYRIDLSQVVSKYIGETEKNLHRIFSAAADSNGILLFDEADALFGKRSEVRDSHDRYANIEIAYLLQKMEEYEGVSILATNLRQNLDDAFVRRLQFIVEFPFPDEEYRRRIWENVFPKETPLGSDVRFDRLAKEVRLAGGNIKNIALAAAFYAAAAGDSVHMGHLMQAAHREYQKLGRSWSRSSEIEIAKATTR
jgi:SpoVK/Ycf46/Vps4 family AAA+-type ATPase